VVVTADDIGFVSGRDADCYDRQFGHCAVHLHYFLSKRAGDGQDKSV